MPTTATHIYTGQKLEPFIDPQNARKVSVRLKASTTFLAGMLLGEVTASPGTAAPYDDSASDGTQTAKWLMPYPATTDASGNITGPETDELGGTSLSIAVYYCGTFKTDDLAQSGAGAIDANGIADLGKLTQGTAASGILRIG